MKIIIKAWLYEHGERKIRKIVPYLGEKTLIKYKQYKFVGDKRILIFTNLLYYSSYVKF